MNRMCTVVVLGVCLTLNLSCTDSRDNADIAELKRTAIERLESNVEEMEGTEDIEKERIHEYRRALRIVSESGDHEIVATPYWVIRHEFGNIPTCRKKIYLNWIETGNHVTGFFLALDGRTLEFPVFDPNSERSKEFVGVILRNHVVYLFGEEYPVPDNYLDEIGPDYPPVTLEPGLLEQLFSYDGDGDEVQIGLLLEDGRKGPTCKLHGPYLASEKPQEGIYEQAVSELQEELQRRQQKAQEEQESGQGELGAERT